MKLDRGLLGDLPQLNSVIAHENYHARFPLLHPNLAYISDNGLPVMRAYARYAEEVGAYYADNTPLRAIPRMAYESTTGALGGWSELELAAPPLLATFMGGAVAVPGAAVLAGAGTYQLGKWYFTPPPFVLPPLTPRLPR
jgi:hypothetical protein